MVTFALGQAWAQDDIRIPNDSELADALDFLNEGEDTSSAPAAEEEDAPLAAAPIETEEASEPAEEAPAVPVIPPVTTGSVPAAEVAPTLAAEIEEPENEPAAQEALPSEETTLKLFEDTQQAAVPEAAEPAAPAPASDKKTSSAPLPPAAVKERPGLYQFAEHLTESEAILFDPQKQPETGGVWKDNRILFQNYEKEGEIQKTAYSIDGKMLNAISMKLVAGRVHVLKFNNAPSGSNFSIRYILSEATATRDPIYAYLRIYVGGHELKRIQISSKDDWKTHRIDMGILSFLDRNLTVTYELTPERVKGLTFSFIAEIRR
jgi:hypothetical protein